MKLDRYKIVHREDGSPREIYSSATTVGLAAQDLEFNVPVILCRLKSEIRNDEHLRHQFTRQVRAVAALRHPRVPVVHALKDSAEDCYFIHQHLEGESLHKMMARRGMIPPEEAFAICLQVADVLETAHKAGLIYGNLAPRDLLQTNAGDIIVTSFDVLPCGENCTPPWTRPASRVEDAQFASPEHLEGGPIGITSSFYAVGNLLWFMLTGRPPYEGAAGAVHEMQQMLSLPVQELAAYPPEIASLLGHLLQLEPERRPSDPAQLKELLETAKSVVERPLPPAFPLRAEPAFFASGAAVVLPKMTAARESAYEKHPRQFAFLEFLAGTLIAVVVYFFMQRPVSRIAPETTPTAQAVIVAPSQK